MNKLILNIPIHSICDLITNSSSETFIINVNTQDATLKEIIEVYIDACCPNYVETKVEKLSDSRYKDSYIIPEHLDINNLYIVDGDQNDYITKPVLTRLFEEVQLEYKE